MVARSCLLVRVSGQIDGVLAVRVENGDVAGLTTSEVPRSCRCGEGDRRELLRPNGLQPAAPELTR
jgi:hypothetical protein